MFQLRTNYCFICFFVGSGTNESNDVNVDDGECKTPNKKIIKKRPFTKSEKDDNKAPKKRLYLSNSESESEKSDNVQNFNEGSNRSNSEISDMETTILECVLYLIKAPDGKSYIGALLGTVVKRCSEDLSLKEQLYAAADIEKPSKSKADPKPTCLLAKKLHLVYGCISHDDTPEKDYMVSITKSDGRYSEKFLQKLAERQPNFMTVKKSTMQQKIFNSDAQRDAYKQKFEEFFKGKVTLQFKVARS